MPKGGGVDSGGWVGGEGVHHTHLPFRHLSGCRVRINGCKSIRTERSENAKGRVARAGRDPAYDHRAAAGESGAGGKALGAWNDGKRVGAVKSASDPHNTQTQLA